MTHVLTNPGFPHDMKFRSKSESWNRDYQDPGNPLPKVTTNHYQTTYNTSYRHKLLAEYTPTRATSPTRRNNPHPTK